MAKRKTMSGGEVYFVENGNFEGKIWRRSKGAHLISIIFFDAFLLIAVVFLLPQEHQVVHLRHQQQHIIELAAVTDTAIAKKGAKHSNDDPISSSPSSLHFVELSLSEGV